MFFIFSITIFPFLYIFALLFTSACSCFYFSILLLAIYLYISMYFYFAHTFPFPPYFCLSFLPSPHFPPYFYLPKNNFPAVFPTLLCPRQLLPSFEADSHSQGVRGEAGTQPALQFGQGESSGHLGISIVAMAGLPEGQLVEGPHGARIADGALEQEAESTHGFKGHQAAAAGMGRG